MRIHLWATCRGISRLWHSYHPISIGSYAPDRRSVIRSCTLTSVVEERRLLRICSCCRVGSELKRAHRYLFVDFCRLMKPLRRPQVSYYNVVRWVHRWSFTIRPPTRNYPPPPPNSRVVPFALRRLVVSNALLLSLELLCFILYCSTNPLS